jgi:hypothetical protein
MASADEQMKLTAELVDKYSGPLKAMRQSLEEMSKTSKKANETSAKAFREHAHRVKELHERVSHLKDMIAGTLTPALASLGISGLAAGEALGELATKLREAGERYNAFNEAMKRSGTSAGYVDAVAASLERLGVAPDRALASVSELGEHLDKLTSGNPDELNAMTSAFGNMGQALHQALDGATSREDQMNRLFNFFDKRKTPVWQKRKFFEALGIPPELAAQSGSELAKVFREEFEREAAHPINVPLMKALDEAFTHLKEAQADFWRDMTNTFGDRAVTVINTFADAVHKVGDAIKYVDDNAPSWWKKTDEFLEKTGKVPTDPKEQLLGPTLPNGKTPFADLRDQIKDGMIAALQWLKSNSTGDAEKLFPGGYVPMAYHPDAGISGAARRAFGGGGYKLLPNGDEGGNLPGAPPEGSNADKGVGGVDLGAGLGGSDFLKAHRQRFADAMKAKPQLRKEIAGMILTEGARDPIPVVESLFNRAEYTGKSLEQLLHSGFYGPINRGQLPAAMARLARDPKLRARMDAAIDAALNGSNLIKGATDQGMRSDPNGRWPGGLIDRGHGNIFNDWGGGPGGHEGARRFREAQQRAVNAHATDAAHAHLRDLIRDHGSLTRSWERSPYGSGGANKVTGDASLTIDLNGFPRGTRYASKADGMFKKVQLNRGRPMQLASQDG